VRPTDAVLSGFGVAHPLLRWLFYNLGGGCHSTGVGSLIRGAGSQIVGPGTQIRAAGSEISRIRLNLTADSMSSI